MPLDETWRAVDRTWRLAYNIYRKNSDPRAVQTVLISQAEFQQESLQRVGIHLPDRERCSGDTESTDAIVQFTPSSA